MWSLIIPVVLAFVLGLSAMGLASRGRRLQYPHNFDSPGPSANPAAKRSLVLGGILAILYFIAAAWAVIALLQPYTRTSVVVAILYAFVLLGYLMMMDEDHAKAAQEEAIKAKKGRHRL